MYFFGVQAAMADQFAVEQQYRDLMAVAHAGGVIAIDIDHIDSDCRRFRHGREGYRHLLTQTAARS